MASFSPRWLEQPSRAHVARDGVYGSLGDDALVVGGVYGRPVARSYADVGDTTAALGPEEQVARGRLAPDRGAIAPLSGRRIGQRDAELGVDQHRVAGAVLSDVDLTGSRRREHVGRAHVGC